jgi:RND superfamily putative drug exporter
MHTQEQSSIPESSDRTTTNALEVHKRYRLGLAFGRRIYRLRWPVIIVWIIGLLVSLPFAAQLPSVLKNGGYNFSGSEAFTVYNTLTDKLHLPPSQLLVVFQSDRTHVSASAYQQEIRHFITRVEKFPHVTGVARGGIGQDGRTTYVTVNFNNQVEDVENQLPAFDNLLPQNGPAQSYVTGEPAFENTLTSFAQSDSEHADSFALPIALLILLIVFGTVLAAFMPLLLALVAVPMALALIYAVATHSLMNASVLSLASIVGLGISIDYSLFLTRRFREELAQGRTVQEAVAWTIATAGEAILFSGLTVIIGLLGLLLIGIQSMSSLGIGGALVVVCAVLGALTLLPALLSIAGTRINALRVPYLSRFTVYTSAQASRNRAGQEHGFWHRLAFAVMRRPIPVILTVILILIGLGWPVFSLNIGTSSQTALPTSTPARKGLDILNAQFPALDENPIDILVQSPDGSSMLTSTNLTRLQHLTQWVAAQKHITQVISLTQLPATQGAPALSTQQLAALYTTGAYTQSPQLAQFVASTTAGNITFISARTDTTIDSDADKALIDTLRAGDKAAGQGLIVQVGGVQAAYLDFDRYLYSNFPKAILFILLATYVLLLIMFRSVLLPLKALLMNVLSVSAAYGVLVFVFQWGNFSNILNFTSSGFIDSLIPILLFCVLFGLSMDYEVFLLSRIREEWLKTHDNTWAVAHGLEQTGSVITSAALIFVIVAGAFIFTTLLITKEMGLGLAVAIFVDATIIRSLLVPATMQLLGKWNWWLPGFSSTSSKLQQQAEK